jgi:DNA-binding NarL/FixJ family response regulator
LLDNGDGDRAAREKLSSMRSVRILVADDHVVVRRGLRALLQAQPPWKVVAEASTGVEAVEKAARLQPDLVIMDLSMPELNGLDATGLILKAAPKTRVLILTMHNAEELIERTLKAGARGYVLKSDAERDLITAIEAVLDNRTFFTPSVSEAVLDCLRQRDRESVNLQGDSLTSRERQIVQLLAEGKSNKEVAGALGISVRTVENHRAKIMRKLQLRSLSDLVRHAIRNKIVEA